MRMQCLCTETFGRPQVLDIGAAVTPDHTSLKEVALFLTQPQILPPDSALGLYIAVGNGWQVTSSQFGPCHGGKRCASVHVLQPSWPTTCIISLANILVRSYYTFYNWFPQNMYIQYPEWCGVCLPVARLCQQQSSL